MIPGLEKAEFARLGGIHRNTFLNSPKLLDGQMRLKSEPRLRFAGQVTGVEGYVERAAIGLVTGRLAAAERLGEALAPPPLTTALGALVGHITGGHLAGEEGGGRPELSADERELRPVSAHRAAEARRRGQQASRARSAASPASARCRARALADLDRWLAAPRQAAAE